MRRHVATGILVREIVVIDDEKSSCCGPDASCGCWQEVAGASTTQVQPPDGNQNRFLVLISRMVPCFRSYCSWCCCFLPLLFLLAGWCYTMTAGAVLVTSNPAGWWLSASSGDQGRVTTWLTGAAVAASRTLPSIVLHMTPVVLFLLSCCCQNVCRFCPSNPLPTFLFLLTVPLTLFSASIHTPHMTA